VRFSKAKPVGGDDFCVYSRPENARGFANTELYRLCGSEAGGGRAV